MCNYSSVAEDSALAYKLLISPSTLGLVVRRQLFSKENAFVSCFSIIFLVVSLGIKTVYLLFSICSTQLNRHPNTSII